MSDYAPGYLLESHRTSYTSKEYPLGANEPFVSKCMADALSDMPRCIRNLQCGSAHAVRPPQS